MRRSLLLPVVVLALNAFVPPRDAAAAMLTKYAHDATGDDFVISCTPGPPISIRAFSVKTLTMFL
jgi:hypothetical protein